VTQYTAQHAETELTGMDMSTAMFDWATTFGGRPDHATTTFVENIKANKMYPECGADDDQGKRFNRCLFLTFGYDISCVVFCMSLLSSCLQHIFT